MVAPELVPPAWPRFSCSTVPAVTGSVAVTAAPSPPATPVDDMPPSAPYKLNVAWLTPAGTVQVWGLWGKVKAQVTWLPPVVQPPEAALARPAGTTATSRASPAAAGIARSSPGNRRVNRLGRCIGCSLPGRQLELVYGQHQKSLPPDRPLLGLVSVRAEATA